ncbi:MAG: NAD(P)-dependent oxidoreductase [Bacteroidetes bacterium]|nr:NAD(P)-dependent oxidoreductase [Bacteroidota bacterium]MBU2585510.1 NAD(P)-dependent oxidoreductase [Bacteroidota bacterium]
MINIAPKLSDQEYEKNFAELHSPMSKNSAIAESNRCLYCYDSPCTKACPTYIDIPAFIKKIATGNLKGSAKTILESNWIALTCAKACPVQVLCEGACVFNEKGEKPIEIGRLQRFVMDKYFEDGMPKLFPPAAKNGKNVGIIGSGPAGLACGAELALLGFDVTIYEAKEIPGGLDTWGVAPYKVRQSDSLKEVKLVESFGVKIITKTRIGKYISFEKLSAKHDAIFIGIGLGESFDLKIEGEDLKGVVGALEFIEEVKKEKWSSVNVGKRVAVIGAGNTSIDAATEAKRLGAEQVMIIYRRSRSEMPAYEFEFELAQQDGVIFYFQTNPVRVIGNSFVEGIECQKMQMIEPDEKGRRRPKPIPNSEFVIPVDMVIKAIGQQTNISFLESIPNLKIENGMIVVDLETYQTGNTKVFAGGDCINGGKEVVNAAYDGKRAAHGIYKYLFEE